MSWCGRTDSEHRVRNCRACQAAYQKHRRVHSPAPPRLKKDGIWQPTKLNQRVDRLHARCQEKGGCIAGPWIISGGWELNPCKRCGVPVKARGFAWADNTTMFPEKGRAA